MTDACKRYTAWDIHKEIERGVNFIDDFVYASDYAALQQQLAQAQGWNDELRTQLREIRAQQKEDYDRAEHAEAELAKTHSVQDGLRADVLSLSAQVADMERVNNDVRHQFKQAEARVRELEKQLDELYGQRGFGITESWK